MVLTTLLFVSLTGTGRWIGPVLPAPESAFLRFVLGIVFLLPMFGEMFRASFDRRLFRLLLARSAVHAVAVMLWFFAMARIPIAEVVAIGYLTPVFVSIGAALFLGERMALRRMAAVLVAFVGALVILRPGFRELGLGHAAQLLSAPFFAVSYLVAKRLSGEVAPSVIVGWMSLIVPLFLAPPAIAQWVTPGLREILGLTLVAAFGTAGHYAMTRAFRAAPVTITQPVVFLQLVWATLLGHYVFGEPVDGWVIAGGAMIVAAVSFISLREAMLSRRPPTPPAPAAKL